MSSKAPECWESDPNATGVKVELSPDDHLLMPFDQFIFAELKPYVGQQQLRLVFVTHEVSVRGDSLNRIETIMQRKQLSVLSEALTKKPRMKKFISGSELLQPKGCFIERTETHQSFGIAKVGPLGQWRAAKRDVIVVV